MSRYNKKGYYIPAYTFYDALKLAGLPLRIIKNKNNVLYVNPDIHNVKKLEIINKQNGTLLKFGTTKNFLERDISSSISSSNWLNITILNCYLDTLSLNQMSPKAPISKIKAIQSNESAQISLLLNTTTSFI